MEVFQLLIQYNSHIVSILSQISGYEIFNREEYIKFRERYGNLLIEHPNLNFKENDLSTPTSSIFLSFSDKSPFSHTLECSIADALTLLRVKEEFIKTITDEIKETYLNIGNQLLNCIFQLYKDKNGENGIVVSIQKYLPTEGQIFEIKNLTK